MKELSKIAVDYAAEKTNEVMTTAIAQAYADGYRDGYKDREEEIPVDIRDNKTEYVDLGLPSGTLWARGYEQKDGNVLYLSYDEASKYQLPTEEQWKELLEICRWEPHYGSHSCDCIGPNGAFITFKSKGFLTSNVKKMENSIYIWIGCQNDNTNKNAIHMYYVWRSGGIGDEIREIIEQFSGYKLPIWLVRK